MFDLTNVEESSFDTLPAGTYNVAVETAEMRDTKSGGQMIAARLTVTNGEHKGRKLFHNFNVKNANETAQSIGMQQLKSMLVAAGWQSFKFDSVTKLEGIQFAVSTKVEKSDQYGEQARVVAFKTPAAQASESLPF
jgi:hypothetical protein